MGWFSSLIGGGGDQIAKPIDSIGNALDKVFTSDDERLSHAEVLEKLQQNLPALQADLDKLNAASAFGLVQFARPFCVYVAGLNFFQLGVAIMWLDRAAKIPQWYIEATVNGFLGALGIYGIARTIEKIGARAKRTA